MQNDPETRESLKRYEAAMVGARVKGLRSGGVAWCIIAVGRLLRGVS